MPNETLGSLINLFFSSIGSSTMIYTRSISLAKSIAELNESDNATKYKRELNYIFDNTTEKIKLPLPALEFLIGRQKLMQIGHRIKVYGKTTTIFDIQIELSRALSRIIEIVSKIAKENDVSVEFDLSLYKTNK